MHFYFSATEIECCFFFYSVKEYKYWKQSTNTVNIALLSANQIADIFRASNKGKNIGKIVSKGLNSKYSQNILDHTKQSATDVIKIASKKSNSKKQQN